MARTEGRAEPQGSRALSCTFALARPPNSKDHGVEAGTAPEVDLKKNGRQKSQYVSRWRLPSRMLTSSVRYLWDPRPSPAGCLNAGQWTTFGSPVFGFPERMNRVQYPLIA